MTQPIRSTYAEYEASKRAMTTPGDSQCCGHCRTSNRWMLWMLLPLALFIIGVILWLAGLWQP